MSNNFTEVESLGFSTRVMNALYAIQINSLEDLARKTELDLYRVPNLGRKSVNEIREILTSHGLMLGMTFPDPASAPCNAKATSGKSVDEWIRKLAGERIPFLQKASLSGCAAADNHLGRLYLEGIGVDRDYRKARVLFIRAARRGCRLGYANLALIYRIGYGVRRSIPKSERLMRRYGQAEGS